ncbi:MAG: 2',3'-cyclic-nucleotide 2'-phosphodiesterase [Mycoplasmataceae bacterium]|nr:MAG: 2',3'-cyclic-nucleotide 2'-phosphodiesterase [Mycoplasmataceae bacterium]
MRILAIGDIFGKTGRKVINEILPRIRKDYNIDLVIANVENATHGKSISHNHYLILKSDGIDVMTSGNHIFSLNETKNYISNYDNLLRPLNSNPFHPGNGSYLLNCKGKKIRVTNLIGNSFMPHSDNPYFAFENILSFDDSDIHIVDFHAETTAEKISFAWHYDGKIAAFYGTHTHVQTADERILPKGTAFITDVGMTGPRDGIIGARPDCIIKRTKYGFSSKMEPNEDLGQFNAIILDFNGESNKVKSIERLNFHKENYSKVFSEALKKTF